MTQNIEETCKSHSSWEEDFARVEAELARIAAEKRAERAAFVSKRNTVRLNKSDTDQTRQTKPEKIQPDTRVDEFVDRIFECAGSAKQGVQSAAGDAADLLKTSTGSVHSKISDKIDSGKRSCRKKAAKAIFALEAKLEQKKHKQQNKQPRFRPAWKPKRRGVVAAAVLLCLFLTSGVFALGKMTYYEYSYNGKVLGTVKDQNVVKAAVGLIAEKLPSIHGAEVMLDQDKSIKFKKVVGWNKEIDDPDQILETFTYLSDMNAVAYSVLVDGEEKVLVDSKNTANRILQRVKEQYMAKRDGVEYVESHFAEEISIKKQETKLHNIQSEEEAVRFMLTGSTEKRTYTVKSGETFNEIAKLNRLTPSDLANSNPGVVPAKLRVGQKLVLSQVNPVLTVTTKELATYTQPINYEIKYEETNALYKNEQRVKSTGTPGEKQIVAEVIKVNGVETGRREISSNVIKPPVAQVVLKGTKKKPALLGSGKFIYPTRGRLSSPFGMRWGRMHNGIDLAAPKGTNIVAADGGTVISAGWEGGLGYCVRINHGGNRVSVYGHCSKLLVKAGAKVYKGQSIAKVGSTGNSTGPHLHFEIRIKGSPVNPLKYL